MDEQKQVSTFNDANLVGKILSNPNKLRALVEISKSPITKAKLADILGLSLPTIYRYVADMINAGLVKETPYYKDGKTVEHVISIQYAGISLVFSSLENESNGWRNVNVGL